MNDEKKFVDVDGLEEIFRLILNSAPSGDGGNSGGSGGSSGGSSDNPPAESYDIITNSDIDDILS